MTDHTLRPTENHSALMDGIYRHQRHIYDLTRKYYLLGRDRTLRDLSMTTRQSLLEIGCGTGRNLAHAARLYPGIRLYGLDISSEMLATAEKNLADDGWQPPVLKLADATRFQPSDFGARGFDRILISYALSMIPEWEAAAAQALDALKPGGSLHVVDFGQQEGLPGWFGALLKAWLAKFHVTPRSNMIDVMTRLADERGFTVDFTSHARGYAWSVRIRRDQG
jgi:S-adenosylmethionine-diacylgycerolhomoserine-N-methlytransferase